MRRPWLVLVSVLTALGLGAALLAGPAVARSRPHFIPGSAGIGDPYFPTDGNGGYDARHYSLDVRYDPATDRLVGQARIRAKATQNLSRFNLDLEDLTVRSVTVNGQRATWRHRDGELTVTPRRGLHKHRTFTVAVRYDGVPQTLEDGSGFIHTDDGALVVGQPQVADTWYPVNDHPSDKASYTFRITVPAGLEAVANGVPRGDRTRRGWTTWLWEAKEPMASYLATATIGEFELKDYRYDGIRMVEAIDPQLFGPVSARTGDRPATSRQPTLGDNVRAAFAKHPQILDFLQGAFGRYPFSASGGIVDAYPGLGFALENQTRPIYAQEWFDRSEETAEGVIVHELAHQWYGDSLAVRQWKDIWLNEGFATYAEWLWWEDQGDATAQQIFDETYAAYTGDDPFWDVEIGDPGPGNLFHPAVYDRGAMTLHQLRLAVGDDDFFAILRGWAARHEDGNVSTPQFVRFAERVSGRQLDALFDAWLFTHEKPGVAASSARSSARSSAPSSAQRGMPTDVRSVQRTPALRP